MFYLSVISNGTIYFVSSEDKGYLISATSLPAASSLQRTIDVSKQISNITKDIPEIENSVIISGFDSFSGASKTNAATAFFTLKP